MKAAETFGEFLSLWLGYPEPLKGQEAGKYSIHVIHVTENIRLIVKPYDNGKAVMTCEEFIMEGVVDYHGGKQTRYIS